MAFTNNFYNETTRKYVSLFGYIFNKISIERSVENVIQNIIVPISYGPYQKFLVKKKQDLNLDKKSAFTMPRMSFELNSMTYDGQRKIGSRKRLVKSSNEFNGGKSYIWSAAPYNLEFSLYIIAKNTSDGTKILEQILPFFRPDWTPSVILIPDLDPFDIPIELQGVSQEEIYEGTFEERNTVMWTLNFTMRAWYFGPERTKSIIKFIDIHMNKYTNGETVEKIQVYPGMTANNTPTTDKDETIPYTEIHYDDNWDIIEEIIQEEE